MNSRLMESLMMGLNASSLEMIELIQELWSGYGQINRYSLSGGKLASVIVKDIDLSSSIDHPRGWNSDLSHQRKLKSYKIESAWYREWTELTTDDCKVPQLYLSELSDEHIILAMEDLDLSGFPLRLQNVAISEIKVVLDWLASFHATFMGCEPQGLWKEGTYWHLNTRPEEWDTMEEGELKSQAGAISDRLANAQFQTIVHGDAKLANFCFSKDKKRVAAVDFQYVGGGCGMKDVAYFLSSCQPEENWQNNEDELLDFYFEKLQIHLQQLNKKVNPDRLEEEWRSLYPFAWADFIRFLKGWLPEHWKIDIHSMKITEKALKEIRNKR